MSRILLTLSTAVLFCVSAFAQLVVFSDNFDSYIAGQQLACQNPIDWTTWPPAAPCDATVDPLISTTFAYSGANSVVIVADNDVVHAWGPVTTGKFEIDFYNYIPTGATGYFNQLGQFTTVQEWGLEVYFNAGGAGVINAGGTGSAAFTYTYDTWVLNQVVVDLDNDMAEYWYNGTMIIQWQWTLGSNGTPIALSLEANDFFGAAATDQMYVDNYVVTDLIAVPVELTSFTANINNLGQVMLNWETATETNNQGFEIERRAENSEFRTIGFVEGYGTTTEQRSYNYLDQNAEQGINYYRLKQVDFNGTYEYSEEVEIDVIGPLTFNLAQNYPNPFNPSTKINYSIPESGNVKLAVYNLVGEEVAVLVDGFTQAGFHETTFDASNLPSGTYLYKLQSANSVQTKKMILLK